MKVMPLQRKDFDKCGNPVGVIWWHGDGVMTWSKPWGFDDLSPQAQAQEMAEYLCRGEGRAYIAVSICWNYPQSRFQVSSDVSTRPVRGPGGITFAMFTTLEEAVLYARSEAARLHRWLNQWEAQPEDMKAEAVRQIIQKAAGYVANKNPVVARSMKPSAAKT